VQVISDGMIDPTGSLTRSKVRMLPFVFFPSLPFLIQSLFLACAIVKKHGVDLFLVYREEDLLVGWFVNKVSNCRLIYWAHGDGISVQQLVSDSILNKLKVSVLIVFEKIFLPKADSIIAVSRDTKMRFLSRLHLDSRKIVVVHNNVLSPFLHSKPLLKKHKRVIGYVGHFSRLKGVETLLYAFFMLSKSINDVILVLVGDGPLKKHFEDMTTLMALQEKVIFTGWVKNPLDFMRDFDILVVPSLYEGCPSIILEAFSLDVPVLGSKAGGIPELLGHEELIFQAMNRDDLASKLKTFLTSEERKRHFRRITLERKKVFTFDHTSLVEQLFLQLLTRT
jgi:glycosyltransferase involved in cell wall biosynthesis